MAIDTAAGARPVDRDVIFDQVRRWSAEIARDAATRDREASLPHAEFESLARTDILAARVPVRHGGPGLAISDLTRIILKLGAADPNIAQIMGVHYCWVEDLLLHATADQQARYFDLVRKGALIAGAQAELGGQSAGDIATRLSSEGETLVLHGRKYYCTGAAVADYLNVSALNDEGELVCVMIPVSRAGVHIADDWNGMGQRTTASGTVSLDQVRVEAAEIIGTQESRKRPNHFPPVVHVLHAAVDAGIAQGALKDGAAYARNKARPARESTAARAIEDPYVVHAFGGMVVAANSAVAMTERAAAYVDRAADHVLHGTGEATILTESWVAVAEAKIVAAESSLRVGETLFSLGGGSGTSRDLNMDRHWRNARTHTTHDPVAYKYRTVGSYYLSNSGALPDEEGNDEDG